MPDALPFQEALDHWLARQVLPTSLTSAEIKQQISAAIRRQSVFSAETAMVRYLEQLQSVIESVINPKQETRLDAEGHPLPQTVTVGYNPATARAALRSGLEAEGYSPGEDIAGTIKDLSSSLRLDLIVNTNTQLAEGAGKFVQANLNPNVVDLWPAWELIRYEDRAQPRNWEQRWQIAAQVAGDPEAAACLEFHGRMCALKSSGIWQQLGEGAGGYDDTLDNPYPPFAFNSGMWTDDVSRDEAVELGLLDEGEKAQPAAFDFAGLFATPEPA